MRHRLYLTTLVFKLLWRKLVWPEIDLKSYIEWFTSFKTTKWSERIAGLSSLSGSSIVARYYLQKISNNKNNSIKKEKESKYVKRYHAVRNFTKPETIADEIFIANEIETSRDFFIQIYGIVNEKCEALNMQFEDMFDERNFFNNCKKEGMKLLKNWNK